MQPVCSCVCHKPLYEVKTTENLKIKFKKIAQNRALNDCSCFCDMPKLEKCVHYALPQQNIVPLAAERRKTDTKRVKKITILDNRDLLPAIKPENSAKELPIIKKEQSSLA